MLNRRLGFSGSDVGMLTLTSVYRHYRRDGKPDIATPAEVHKRRKLWMNSRRNLQCQLHLFIHWTENI
jgi:hypothetical protein